MTVLQESLKVAKRAAQVPPVTVQLAQCEQLDSDAKSSTISRVQLRMPSVRRLRFREHAANVQVNSALLPIDCLRVCAFVAVCQRFSNEFEDLRLK